jgi:hypothetical protein
LALQLGVHFGHSILDYIIWFHTGAEPSDFLSPIPEDLRGHLEKLMSSYGALRSGFQKIAAGTLILFEILCIFSLHLLDLDDKLSKNIEDIIRRYVLSGAIQWKSSDAMVNLVTLGFARFQRHEGDRIVCDESLPIVAAIVWLQQTGKLAQAIFAQYWDAPIAPVRGCIYEILVGLVLAMLYSGPGSGRPFTESLKFPGDIPPWAHLRARSVALRKRGNDLVVEYRDLPRAGPSRCFPAPWFFRSASSDETISFLEGLSNDGTPILIPDPNHHGDLLMPFLLENGVVMVMVIQCKDYAKDLPVDVLLKAIDSVTPIFAFLNKDSVRCIEYLLFAALVLIFFNVSGTIRSSEPP